MTVCIAARSYLPKNRFETCIVGVCDMMLSTPKDSSPASDDIEIKILQVSRRWHALYAGAPTFARDVADRARAAWRERAPNESLSEMRSLMKWAFRGEVRQQVTDRFLAPYEISLDRFRRVGRKQLGDFEFEQIHRAIRSYNPGAGFLVCGYENKFPHIFTVLHPGITVLNDPLGHAAIGSGAQMALGALGLRPIGLLPFHDLLFRVCEAKFAAETAKGVGKGTILTVIHGDFEHKAFGVTIDQLRAVSERLRAETIPDDAIGIIDQAFGSSGVMMGINKPVI